MYCGTEEEISIFGMPQTVYGIENTETKCRYPVLSFDGEKIRQAVADLNREPVSPQMELYIMEDLCAEFR